MSFYNGVPIAVVSIVPGVSMPTDSRARRPIDEEKSPQAKSLALMSRTQKRDRI